MKLAENLKAMRTAKNMSQALLAEKLNVSLKTISHWETSYSEPSIVQLIQLANLFDMSIDELVGRIN